MPGSQTSIAYRASPVVFARPSSRGTRVPRMAKVVEGSQGAGSPASIATSLVWKSPLKPTRTFSVISGLLGFDGFERGLRDTGVVREARGVSGEV
jgi:hypothetical protein